MGLRPDIIAGKAVIVVNIQDTVDRQLRNIRASFRRFSHSLSTIGGDLFRFGAVGSAASILPVREFMLFQDQILFLQTKLQSTDADTEKLSDKIRELGKTTSFTSTQVAKAATELAKAGFSMQEITNSLQSALDLARGGQVDLTTSTAILANTIRTFGVDTNQASVFASKFITAARMGTLDIVDLNASLKYSSATFRQLGIDINKALSLISQLSLSSIRASMAGTSLNTAFINIARRAEEFQSFTGFVVDDEMLANPLIFLTKLQAALSKLSTVERRVFMSRMTNIRGDRAISGILIQGLEGQRDILREISKSTNEARISAAKLDSQLGGVFRRTLSAFQELQLTIGGSTEGPLTTIGNALRTAFTVMSDVGKRNPQLLQTMVLIPPAILAAGGAMLFFSMALRNVASILTLVIGLNNVLMQSIYGVVKSSLLLASSPIMILLSQKKTGRGKGAATEFTFPGVQQFSGLMSFSVSFGSYLEKLTKLLSKYLTISLRHERFLTKPLAVSKSPVAAAAAGPVLQGMALEKAIASFQGQPLASSFRTPAAKFGPGVNSAAAQRMLTSSLPVLGQLTPQSPDKGLQKLFSKELDKATKKFFTANMIRKFPDEEQRFKVLRRRAWLAAAGAGLPKQFSSMFTESLMEATVGVKPVVQAEVAKTAPKVVQQMFGFMETPKSDPEMAKLLTGARRGVRQRNIAQGFAPASRSLSPVIGEMGPALHKTTKPLTMFQLLLRKLKPDLTTLLVPLEVLLFTIGRLKQAFIDVTYPLTLLKGPLTNLLRSFTFMRRGMEFGFLGTTLVYLRDIPRALGKLVMGTNWLAKFISVARMGVSVMKIFGTTLRIAFATLTTASGWGNIITFLLLFGDKIPGISHALQGLKDAFTDLFQSISRTFKQLAIPFGTISAGFEFMKIGETDKAFEVFKTGLMDIRNIISVGFSDAWSEFLKKVDPGVRALKGSFMSLLAGVEMTLNLVASLFGQVFKGSWKLSGMDLLFGDGEFDFTKIPDYMEVIVKIVGSFLHSILKGFTSMFQIIQETMMQIQIAMFRVTESVLGMAKSPLIMGTTKFKILDTAQEAAKSSRQLAQSRLNVFKEENEERIVNIDDFRKDFENAVTDAFASIAKKLKNEPRPGFFDSAHEFMKGTLPQSKVRERTEGPNMIPEIVARHNRKKAEQALGEAKLFNSIKDMLMKPAATHREEIARLYHKFAEPIEAAVRNATNQIENPLLGGLARAGEGMIRNAQEGMEMLISSIFTETASIVPQEIASQASKLKREFLTLGGSFSETRGSRIQMLGENIEKQQLEVSQNMLEELQGIREEMAFGE